MAIAHNVKHLHKHIKIGEFSHCCKFYQHLARMERLSKNQKIVQKFTPNDQPKNTPKTQSPLDHGNHFCKLQLQKTIMWQSTKTIAFIMLAQNDVKCAMVIVAATAEMKMLSNFCFIDFALWVDVQQQHGMCHHVRPRRISAFAKKRHNERQKWWPTSVPAPLSFVLADLDCLTLDWIVWESTLQQTNFHLDKPSLDLMIFEALSFCSDQWFRSIDAVSWSSHRWILWTMAIVHNVKHLHKHLKISEFSHCCKFYQHSARMERLSKIKKSCKIHTQQPTKKTLQKHNRHWTMATIFASCSFKKPGQQSHLALVFDLKVVWFLCRPALSNASWFIVGRLLLRTSAANKHSVQTHPSQCFVWWLKSKNGCLGNDIDQFMELWLDSQSFNSLFECLNHDNILHAQSRFGRLACWNIHVWHRFSHCNKTVDAELPLFGGDDGKTIFEIQKGKQTILIWIGGCGHQCVCQHRGHSNFLFKKNNAQGSHLSQMSVFAIGIRF